MTLVDVFVILFIGLLVLAVVEAVLGWLGFEDDPPLPTSRYLVTQGGNVYSCDTAEEAAAMAEHYPGLTRIERRHR